MNETSKTTYFVAQTSTPVATPTPTQAPDWMFLAVPFLSFLGALLGGVLAAWVTNRGNRDVEKLRQTFEQQINAERQEHGRKRDEERQQHDEKMQQLQAEHEKQLEAEREKRTGRRELIQEWEDLLDESSLGTWRLVQKPTYRNLEKYFSPEFK
ncbi:hypothetical protein C7271_22800, partial [filamentous cyanobacterium CCP5]